MRDLVIWIVALLFLFSSFHTVKIRRDVDALGSENGALERSLLENRRRNDNLELQLERMLSPAELVRRAADAEIFLQESGVPLR